MHASVGLRRLLSNLKRPHTEMDQKRLDQNDRPDSVVCFGPRGAHVAVEIAIVPPTVI